MARHLKLDKGSFMMQGVVLFMVLVNISITVVQSEYKVVYKKIPDNRGTKFVIGFMQQFKQESDGSIRLFITSDYDTQVVIVIPESLFKTTINIKARQLQTFDVSNSLRMKGTGIEKKGILITSLEEVVVYGLNIKKYTTDAFLALPVDIQSNMYIVPSFQPSQHSLIGIVGIEEKTKIFITFRFAKRNSFFKYKGRKYRHGDTLYIQLGPLETLQIAHTSDMTGTRIYALKPISVFSGNECANVPKEKGYCDHLVEHIPPVNTWGTRFITAPLLGRTGGDFFRILSSNDSTHVRVNGRHIKTLQEGTFIELDVASSQYQYIETSKPCLVVQYSKGSLVDRTRTDPFMVMIPPIEQYTAQYTVSTPDQSKEYFKSYINVIIETKHIDGLRLDTRSLRDKKWTPVLGTDHSVARLPVSHGVHSVMHDSPIVPFAIFMYGFSRADSYGYPGGLRLADLTLQCVPGNPGDGLDNDCDRRIDEEIKNYIDDDNDGRIDEDLVTDPPELEFDTLSNFLRGCPLDVKKNLKEPQVKSAPLCNSRGPVKLTFGDKVTEKSCVQYIARTWYVRDGCGNLANVTQDIRISRPDFQVTFPSDVRGVCSDDTDVTGKPEVTGSCEGDVFSIKHHDTPTVEECKQRGRTIGREWTVKASCGSAMKRVQRLFPDLTPPKLHFVGKLQYQVRENFRIHWNASEESTFECSLDNPNEPQSCGNGLGGLWGSSDIPGGKHIFWVRGTDLAGNLGAYIKHPFNVDKSGPRLEFRRPLKTLSQGSMTIAWRSTELARFKCGLSLTRMELCGSGSVGRSYLRNLPDGVHGFYVGARDAMGNEANIIKHTFRIDSTPPRIKFGKSLPLNINAKVDLPIISNEEAKFFCSLDAKDAYQPCGTGLRGNFVANNLSEGPHILYVKAEDPAGNVADPIVLSWNSDKTSPNILFDPGLPTKFRGTATIKWSSTEYAKFECAMDDNSRLFACGQGTQGQWSKDRISDGSHSLYVRGTDRHGNVGPLANFRFLIDNLPPVVRLNTPLPRTSTSKTLTFRWTSNEMAYYNCAVDNAANTVPCGSGNDGEWTTPSLPDGSHMFFLSAKDEVGNKARPLRHSWKIDNVAPNVRFIGKLPDSSKSDYQPFSWYSTEYAKFQCSIDSTTNFSPCGTGTRGRKTVNDLDDGTHTFRVKAVDSHGNEGPVIQHTWKIDTKAPSVTLGTVPSTSNKPKVKFTWDSTEPAKFRCAVDDDKTGIPCGNGTEGEYLTPTLVDGEHEFRLLVEDFVGNLAPLIRSKFETDTAGPVIRFNQEDPKKPQKQIGVSWRSSEESEFECALDDPNEYEKCGNGKSGVFQKEDLPDGEHKLYVRGTDKLKNVGKPSVFTVTTDKTAPTLKFSSKANPLSNKHFGRFTWTSDEKATFNCKVDDREIDCGQGKTGAFTTSSLRDGEHVFQVTPVDEVGNEGKELETTWKIDSTAPPVRYTNLPPKVSGDHVTFKWSSPESATFECALDDINNLKACGSGTSGGKKLSRLPKGVRTFWVRGTDEAGNVGSLVPHSWTVDTNPPRIEFTGDLPSFSKKSLTLNWRSDETSNFECALDDMRNFQPCGSGTQGHWTNDELPEGRHTFYVRAKDVLNNVGEPISHSWVVDSTPPRASISPVRPVTNSHKQTLQWRADERSKFYCAIGDVGNSIECGSGTEGSWTTPYLRRGPQQFWLIAEDYTGNRAEPVSVSWTIDSEAPTVTFSKDSKKKSDTSRPKFSWTSDEDATFLCAIEGLTQYEECGQGTSSSWTGTNVPDGKHNFRVKARDRHGNERPFTFPFEIDTTPPTGFSVIVPRRRTNKPRATFKWRTSEDAKYDCYLDNQTEPSDCGTGTNGQVTTDHLPDGDHNFKVVATDDIGNKAPVVKNKWTIDTAGPTIKFPRDLPKTTLNSPIFNWKSSEPAAFQCSLDDARSWRNCGSGITGTWQRINLLDGNHTLYVRGSDDLGNVGQPDFHKFTVDNQAPLIKLTSRPDRRSSKPRFEWTSSEDVVFECSLDDAPLTPCGRGKTGSWVGKNVNDGRHKFVVQGKDEMGNTGRHTHLWTIDSNAPVATLTGELPTDSNKLLVIFSWKANENAKFTCAIKTGNSKTSKPVSCGFGTYGQFATPTLPDGEHTFYLTPEDLYGNRGPVVEHTWRKDSSSPVVTVNPDTSVYSTPNPRFTWTSSEDATFECAIDDTALYQDCGSGTSGTFTANNVPSGRHAFFIRGKDKNNNYGEHVQYQFRVDTLAPRVFLTNTVPPKTRNPRVTFGWTSSEDSNFECKLDDKVFDCGSGSRGKYTTRDLPDGKHTFSLNTVDNVGNKGTPVTVNWETDSTSPVIQFISELPKTTNRNPSATWNSSESANYDCALDNLNNRIQCGSGIHGKWNGGSIPRGPHTFSVRGTDIVGNVGEWKSYSFDVDDRGPVISFPDDQPKVTKNNPTFNWSSSEPGKFKCGIDNSFNMVDCGQGTNGQWTGQDIPDGRHVFLVYGVDDMNNRGDYKQHRFTVDNNSPVIRFRPLPDTTSSSLRIGWTSTENARFECSLDGADFVVCGSGLSGEWTGKNIPHGKHVISVRGRDQYGNVGEPTSHTWNVDTSGPKVSIIEPFPTKTSQPVSVVRWTSDKYARFKCAVDDLSRAVSCGTGKFGQWSTPSVSDGEHTLYITAEDTFGNSGPPLSRKWSVDSSSPVVTVNPDTSVYNTSNPRFTWTSSEDATFECAIDDTALYQDCGSGTSGTFTASNVPSGRHAFFIRGKDSVNNYGQHLQYLFNVDTQAPQVYLTNSVRPKSRNPTATFAWFSSEDSTFECKLDGKVVDCSATGRSGRYTTPRLPDGNHTFSLNTVDNVGNKGTPTVVNWEIDANPPVVKVNPDTSVYNTSSPSFTWTSSEDATFECAIDNTRFYKDCGTGTDGKFTGTNVPSGDHMFFMRAKDKFNNYGPHVRYPFRVDTNPPRVYLTRGIPQTTNKPKVTVSWSSNEDSKFECQVDGKAVVDCGSGTRGSYTTSDLPDGKHRFTLNTVDNVGNKGTPLTVDWVKDSRAPEIQFDPSLPKKNKENPVVKWSSSKPSNYQCALNDLNNVIRCGGGTTGQWRLHNVPKGPHKFWVRGTDNLGNVGEWKSYSFDVDAEGPVISFPANQPTVTKNNPSFNWSSSEPGKFKCGIDNSFNMVDCGQGTNGQWTGQDIPDGRHVFLVYGVDDMNNRGRLTQHRFTVDNNSPVIVFPQQPDETSSTPRIRWTSTEDARFECSLDGADYQACGRGFNGLWTATNIPHGQHVFSVRGIDKNGNVGEPTKFTWNVDSSHPNVRITEPFPQKSSNPVSRIQWTSDENANFKCAVDDVRNAVSCGYGNNGQWVTPKLPDGEHTFFLTSEDNFKNKAPTLSRKWLIDSKAPVVTVNPDTSVYNTPNPRFTWTSSEDATFECAIDDTALYQDCGSGTDGTFTANNVPSGRHMLYVRAKDSLNNYGHHIRYPFKVDTLAPRISTNGLPPKTKNPKVTIDWSSNEDSNFECQLDGKRVECGSGTRGTYTTPDLPDGRHTFSLNAVDKVGNKGTPVVMNWNIDSTAPEIQFPGDLPKTTKGNPQVRWSSSEPSNFECALDDLKNRIRCSGGTNGQWNGVNLPKGPHTFWVRGTDDVKNVGEWKPYTFNVDTTGPKISFPANQPKVTKNNPTFNWSSSEPAKFKCGIDNSFNMVDCDQGTNGQWTGQDIPDGPHVFLVYGVDDLNNAGPYAQHRFTVDKSAPVIVFSKASDTTGSTPQFTWTSTEDARFECSLDSADYKDCGSGFDGVWTGTNVPHGRHVLSVRGSDKNGNLGKPTQHPWNVDTRPPKVTIKEPFPKKTSVPIAKVRWTSDERAKFKCAIDDLTNPVSCGFGEDGQWVTPRVPDGEHTFYLISEDMFGNRGPTLSRKWTVDSSYPRLTFSHNSPETSGKKPMLTWTSSEYAKFECILDDFDKKFDCGGGINGSWTGKNLKDGRHLFWVRGTDSSDNTGPFISHSWIIDDSAPRLRFLGVLPPRSRTFPTFRWVSNEVANFECSLNNGKFTRCGRGISGFWSKAEIRHGRHVFRVRGIDDQGNVGEPISHEISIDTTPPNVKLMDPIPPPKTRSPTATFLWTSDEDGKFTCAVDDFSNQVDCGQGRNGRFTTQSLSDGKHRFYLLAEDELGNRARVITHRWVVDKIKPQVVFLPNQPRISDADITVHWRTTTNTPASFQCALDNRRNMKPCGEGKTGSWIGRKIPDGRHKLYVVATDSFGEAGVVKEHRWRVDTKVPRVELIDKPPKRSRSTTSVFSWRSDENATFECAIDVVETGQPCGEGRHGRWISPELSQGDHTFYLFATDINGNNGEPIQYAWNIDSLPPVITMDANLPTVSSNNVTIKWTSTEPATFECAVDSIFDDVDCGFGKDGDLVLTNLDEGQHTVWIKAVDDLGNHANWARHSWLVDSKPPKLDFTNALPKKTNGTPIFFWRTGEDSVFECGTDENNLKGCGNGQSGKWTGRNLTDGEHRFFVKAKDRFGNTVTIEHIWTVDTRPPILTFTRKPPAVSGKKMKFKWKSDELANFTCAHEHINEMKPCGEGWKGHWKDKNMPEGKHRFWVTGIDGVGNRGKPLEHEWTVDTKGPVLFFNEPVPKKSGGSVRFSWRSNENASFSCAFENPENFFPCGDGYMSSIRSNNLKRNGKHRIYVKGVDKHGNEGNPIEAEWNVDLVAPVLIEVGPLPHLTNKNPIITWTVNEEAVFECALDDLNKFEWCGNGTTGDFRGHDLDKGKHKLIVRAVDPQGNTNPILNHTFVVGIPDNRGREFVLAFMQQYNQKHAGAISLFITSDNKTRAEISIPGLDNYHRSVSLQADELVRVDLPLRARLSGTQKEKKGILVTADHELVIYGLNIMAHSTDAFLALPTDIQGSEYYAVSYTVSQHSLIAVVGIYDNTTVFITLRMDKDVPFVYQGSVYRNGDTMIISLNRLQTFQVAHTRDLTGTRIYSTRAVSVYSGNECANVPKEKGYCDHLVEMLTPTSTWGRRFVTAPLFSRKSGDFFRVVASQDHTSVVFHPGERYFLNAGDFVERDVPSDEYQFITATNPCMLLQYSKGADTDGTDTDPFLIMIPPIEQYGSHYILSTPDRPTQQYFQSYINVIVLTEHLSGILVDGNPAYHLNPFTKIKGTPYSASAVSVTKGVHRVDHTSPIVTFGAFMYGYAWRDSYGYPGGLRLADITGECTAVDTPADGMDNDCDRRIDEELKNGIDDDGDGRIDEDLATFPPEIQLRQPRYEYESCTLEVDALVPRAKAIGSVECEGKGALRLTYSDQVVERECTRAINRTWQAADGCGNVVYLTQYIKITKPRLVVRYPVHVPNGCHGKIDLTVTGGPEIESICEQERVRVSYRDNISVIECQKKGLLLVREFTVNELCGREYTGTQRIYPGAAN